MGEVKKLLTEFDKAESENEALSGVPTFPPRFHFSVIVSLSLSPSVSLSFSLSDTHTLIGSHTHMLTSPLPLSRSKFEIMKLKPRVTASVSLSSFTLRYCYVPDAKRAVRESR